jgi:sulfite reductase beta subunit-like hemoprotein
MEIAPDLQFMHYTVAEAKLPAEALASLTDVPLETVAICCDLERNVFNPEHTDERVAAALRATHWFDLREYTPRP